MWRTGSCFSANCIYLPQVTGVAVMVVGVWCVAGDGRDVMLVLAPTPDHLPTLIHLAYGLVGAGGVVLLTSVLGVWAALKENKCGLGWVSRVFVVNQDFAWTGYQGYWKTHKHFPFQFTATNYLHFKQTKISHTCLQFVQSSLVYLYISLM